MCGKVSEVASLERRRAVNFKQRLGWLRAIVAATIFFVAACSSPSVPESTITPTPSPTEPATSAPTTTPSPSPSPTPTTASVEGPEPTAMPVPSRCDGLGGELEIRIQVGPAEAVGLEPVAVGSLPFSVVSDGGVYLVQGGGAVSYQDVLEKEWGTYTVSLDMDGLVDGECGGEDGSESLNLTVEMSGEQMVEVRAQGFQGDYPWAGTHQLDLSFPLEEGASAEGEGWAFVLHLSQ